MRKIDPLLAIIMLSVIFLTLLTVIENPSILLTTDVKNALGWSLLGSFSASALCFTFYPVLKDQPYLQVLVRKSGGQFASSGLFLLGALLVTFIGSTILGPTEELPEVAKPLYLTLIYLLCTAAFYFAALATMDFLKATFLSLKNDFNLVKEYENKGQNQIVIAPRPKSAQATHPGTQIQADSTEKPSTQLQIRPKFSGNRASRRRSR